MGYMKIPLYVILTGSADGSYSSFALELELARVEPVGIGSDTEPVLSSGKVAQGIDLLGGTY